MCERLKLQRLKLQRLKWQRTKCPDTFKAPGFKLQSVGIVVYRKSFEQKINWRRNLQQLSDVTHFDISHWKTQNSCWTRKNRQLVSDCDTSRFCKVEQINFWARASSYGANNFLTFCLTVWHKVLPIHFNPVPHKKFSQDEQG